MGHVNRPSLAPLRWLASSSDLGWRGGRHCKWVLGRTLSLGLVFVCLFGAQVPCSAEDDELQRLNEQVRRLKDANAKLEARMLVLAAMLEGTGLAGTSYTAVLVEPEQERSLLDAISLRGSASKDEVRRYVGLVLGVTLTRDYFSDTDPAVAKLRLVGSSNVDVLLDALRFPVANRWYALEALKSLAEEGHREAVIGGLSYCPGLIEVVVQRGWVKQAAPTVMAVVRRRDFTTEASWVRAAASIARPEDNPDLLWHVLHGSSPYESWIAVRDVRGMSELLASAVVSAWSEIVQRPPELGAEFHRRELARVAAHYGAVDALGELVLGDYPTAEDYTVFKRLTGFAGPKDAAADWYRTRVGALRFEFETGRYRAGS